MDLFVVQYGFFLALHLGCIWSGRRVGRACTWIDRCEVPKCRRDLGTHPAVVGQSYIVPNMAVVCEERRTPWDFWD